MPAASTRAARSGAPSAESPNQFCIWVPRTPHPRRADACLLVAILMAAPLNWNDDLEDEPIRGRDLPVSLLANLMCASRRKVQLLLEELRGFSVIDHRKAVDENQFATYHEAEHWDVLPLEVLGKARTNTIRTCAVLFGESVRQNPYVRSDAERAQLAHVGRGTVTVAVQLLQRLRLVNVTRPMRRLGGGHVVRLRQLRRAQNKKLVTTLRIRNTTVERLEATAQQGRGGVQPENTGVQRQHRPPVQPQSNPNASPSEKDLPVLRTQSTARAQVRVPVPEIQPERVPESREMGQKVAEVANQLRADSGICHGTKKGTLQANVPHLLERLEKAPDAVGAITGAALAAGAWVANKKPLVPQATRVAEHLVERHGPEQAKAITAQVLEDVATDAGVRDPAAVVAHRLRMAAVAPAQEPVRPAPAPMAEHLLQRQLAHGTQLCVQVMAAPEGPQRIELGRQLAAFVGSTPAQRAGHTLEVLADAAAVPLENLRLVLSAVPLRRRLA